ncbi:MAG TPA: diguanylate cyclase [Thermodesulfatator atlanticus]|uniref:Diguanylate cyclase n=1 Tax=Thermodesulfatator atlanticus TaxID=501497 RepID=A0A7V5U278_9BACT|nr:diguanylate cyclase [Thermodesulfatator atlanticus]
MKSRFLDEWRTLTLYEKFEQIISLILTAIIASVILVALGGVIRETYFLLFKVNWEIIDHKFFQKIFGMIMTLLIALEFKHSILKVSLRKEGIVQIKTVILIALLALVRKFIIIDLKAVSPAKLAALAFAVLVLGGLYWLLREQYLRYRT